MSYAVFVCCLQYDHLPGGPLETPGADQLLAPILALINHEDCAAAIAVREWHPENHYSFSDNPQFTDHSWPPHCVQGTKGARMHRSISRYADYMVSIGMNRNEEAYSAFAGKTLRPVHYPEEILALHNVDTVVVTGIRYSVEVKHTALDAAALGYRTIVPLDTTVAEGDPNRGDTIGELARVDIWQPSSYREINDSH